MQRILSLMAMSMNRLLFSFGYEHILLSVDEGKSKLLNKKNNTVFLLRKNNTRNVRIHSNLVRKR